MAVHIHLWLQLQILGESMLSLVNMGTRYSTQEVYRHICRQTLMHIKKNEECVLNWKIREIYLIFSSFGEYKKINWKKRWKTKMHANSYFMQTKQIFLLYQNSILMKLVLLMFLRDQGKLRWSCASGSTEGEYLGSWVPCYYIWSG